MLSEDDVSKELEENGDTGDDLERGWHKLLTVTDVYKSSNPYSTPFEELPKGQAVHVCEFKRDGLEGRKCRIDSPVRGWLHLAPKNAIIVGLVSRVLLRIIYCQYAIYRNSI